MLNLLGGLLGIIPGLFTTVNGITNAIANEKLAQLSATTQQDQIASQERVNTLQAQRDVLIAESSKSSLDIWVRALLVSGPVFILNKIFIYDKAFDQTTLMSSDLWNVVYIILGFYFLHFTISKVK